MCSSAIISTYEYSISCLSKISNNWEVNPHLGLAGVPLINIIKGDDDKIDSILGCHIAWFFLKLVLNA